MRQLHYRIIFIYRRNRMHLQWDGLRIYAGRHWLLQFHPNDWLLMADETDLCIVASPGKEMNSALMRNG